MSAAPTQEIQFGISWKTKIPERRDQTTDRYDMAIAGAALQFCRAKVIQICVPYPVRPAHSVASSKIGKLRVGAVSQNTSLFKIRAVVASGLSEGKIKISPCGSSSPPGIPQPNPTPSCDLKNGSCQQIVALQK
jgi:hypothetical protein